MLLPYLSYVAVFILSQFQCACIKEWVIISLPFGKDPGNGRTYWIAALLSFVSLTIWDLTGYNTLKVM